MRLELNQLSPATVAIIEAYYRSERALSAFSPGSEEAAFGSRWEVSKNCVVSLLSWISTQSLYSTLVCVFLLLRLPPVYSKC